MPIHVVCQACKSSFQVSEKFAGKKGPCPKCKAVIQVPEKAEEIVIHAPAPSAPTDSKGVVVTKPISRQETRFSKPLAIASGIISLVSLILAIYLRTYGGKPPQVMLILGATILGPLLSWAGYGFLRNDEYEPFRGRELWVRALICGALYAVLWGLYAYVVPYALDLGVKRADIYQLVFIVPPIVLAGGGIALVSLDLEYGSGLVHYGLYLVVTITLSYLAKVPVF